MGNDFVSKKRHFWNILKDVGKRVGVKISTINSG